MSTATSPASPSPGVVGTESGRDWRATILDGVGRFGMIAVLIALAIAAQVVYPRFLEIDNLRDMMIAATPVGLVAVGMTFVLIGGGFDLSVAGIFAAAGMLYATLANDIPVGLAAAAMLPIAVVMGLANGLVITRLQVNAFVATLGSASIFSGIAYFVSETGTVAVTKASYSYLGTAKWFGVPLVILILAFVFILGGFLLAKTVYGRSVYIVGGNPEAARLSGMRVSSIQASTYVLTAMCAVLGGMLLSSETSVAQASVGANITLDSIAVVIIGGTSLRGGQGAMWRTLVGLLIIATMNNLFTSLAWNSAIQMVTKGGIIIGAVALDAWTQRRAGRG